MYVESESVHAPQILWERPQISWGLHQGAAFAATALLLSCSLQKSPWKTNQCLCSHLRGLFILIAHDHNHGELWFPGWKGAQWRKCQLIRFTLVPSFIVNWIYSYSKRLIFFPYRKITWIATQSLKGYKVHILQCVCVYEILKHF